MMRMTINNIILNIIFVVSPFTNRTIVLCIITIKSTNMNVLILNTESTWVKIFKGSSIK